MGKLSPKQERFKNNLLKGMDKGKAYEAAGYIARGGIASTNASKLLKNAKFAKAYSEALERVGNKAEATKERIILEECRLAYSDLRQIFKDGTTISPDQLPEDVARSISGVEIIERVIVGNNDEQVLERKFKYRFWDKGRALERISKHLGLYEKDNEQSRPVIVSELSKEDREHLKNAAMLAAGKALK